MLFNTRSKWLSAFTISLMFKFTTLIFRLVNVGTSFRASLNQNKKKQGSKSLPDSLTITVIRLGVPISWLYDKTRKEFGEIFNAREIFLSNSFPANENFIKNKQNPTLIVVIQGVLKLDKKKAEVK